MILEPKWQTHKCAVWVHIWHPKITPRSGWYHIFKIIKKNWGSILTYFMAQIKIVKLSPYSGSDYYVAVIYIYIYIWKNYERSRVFLTMKCPPMLTFFWVGVRTWNFQGLGTYMGSLFWRGPHPSMCTQQAHRWPEISAMTKMGPKFDPKFSTFVDLVCLVGAHTGPRSGEWKPLT